MLNFEVEETSDYDQEDERKRLRGICMVLLVTSLHRSLTDIESETLQVWLIEYGMCMEANSVLGFRGRFR